MSALYITTQNKVDVVFLFLKLSGDLVMESRRIFLKSAMSALSVGIILPSAKLVSAANKIEEKADNSYEMHKLFSSVKNQIDKNDKNI